MRGWNAAGEAAVGSGLPAWQVGPAAAPTGMCTHGIPENRFSFKAGGDCRAREGWVEPWLGAVSSLLGEEAK